MKSLHNKSIILFLGGFAVCIFACLAQSSDVVSAKYDNVPYESFKLANKIYKSDFRPNVLITSVEYSEVALPITELFEKNNVKIKKHIVINSMDDFFKEGHVLGDRDRVLVVGDVISKLQKKEFLDRLISDHCCFLPSKNIKLVKLDRKNFPKIDIRRFLGRNCNSCTEPKLRVSGKFVYIDFNELIIYSLLLAKKVFDSGFRPDYIFALWRGGGIVAKLVRMALEYYGVKVKDIVSIRTIAYEKYTLKSKVIVEQKPVFPYEADFIEGASVLIVDDLVDSGKTMIAVEKHLEKSYDLRLQENIRTATIFRKPDTEFNPDYSVLKENRWIVFFHELVGLNAEQIEELHGVKIAEVLGYTAG